MRGLETARSKVVYFRHNDANDLERILLAQRELDRRQPKKAAAQRRFLITEAIFLNTGEMCPLARLVALRAEHKLRFILDESLTFGTVGKNGRGLTELLNVDVSSVIDFKRFLLFNFNKKHLPLPVEGNRFDNRLIGNGDRFDRKLLRGNHVHCRPSALVRIGLLLLRIVAAIPGECRRQVAGVFGGESADCGRVECRIGSG